MSFSKPHKGCHTIFGAFLFAVFLISIPQQTFADTNSIATIVNSLFPSPATITPPPISESDLASLTEPGIVRIAEHSKGSVTLNSDFTVDWKNHTVTAIPISKPLTLPIDSYALGSGFIITPNGYIVTNSHVVSKEEAVLNTMSQLAQLLIQKNLESLSAADQKAVEQQTQSLDGSAAISNMGLMILKDMLANSSSTVDVTVTVLDPTSSATTLSTLISSGFPAKVISVDDNFTNDNKDVAVIKIDQTDLPALPISSDVSANSINVGQTIHIFGFPSTADINSDLGGTGFLTPTFSSGSITAFKDSVDGSFKLIETDAKASSGSSGSPFLNDKGEVIGIMTYGSATDSTTIGDGFSFAIPLNVITPIIQQAGIQPVAGDLYTHFMNGLNFSANSHCASAITEFNAAQSINTHFAVGNFISSYIQKCETLQANGASIDSDGDQMRINLESIQTPLIFGAGGLILLIIILIIFIWLMRKLRRDEKMIANMNMNQPRITFKHAAVAPSPTPSAPPATAPAQIIAKSPIVPFNPPPAPAVPTNTPIAAAPGPLSKERIDAVTAYIAQAKKSATANNGQIVIALRNEKYSDREIQEGFNRVNNINV